MSNAPKIKVTFEAIRGAGEQIGWLRAAGLASIPGLSINYFPVFRSPETGSIRLLALALRQVHGTPALASTAMSMVA
jgi:hypothetical protein